MPRSVDYYNALWGKMRITRPTAVSEAARRCIAFKSRYMAIDRLTGVPWRMIAVLHMRESGNDFRGVLHNGEHIIGTGRRTHLAPAGRGPFTSWESAAVDALAIKGIVGKPATYWEMGRILQECERFNGWGYAMRGKPSPYVWAGSDQYSRGKFVSDGNYSSSFVDPQLGVAPVMQSIMAMDGVHPSVRTPMLTKPEGGWKAWGKRTLEATGVTTLLSWNTVDTVQTFLSQHQLVLLIGAGVGLWFLLNYLEGGPKDKNSDVDSMDGVAQPANVG